MSTTADRSSGTGAQRTRRQVEATISRGIVRIYARLYDRGPTKTRTIYHDDFVFVLLEDALTDSEHYLIAAGRFNEVRKNRQTFRDAVEPRLREVVSESTGRPVLAMTGQLGRDGRVGLVFLLRTCF